MALDRSINATTLRSEYRRVLELGHEWLVACSPAGCMNDFQRVQLVVADVDGTLVMPDKTITERARAAVRKLGEANIAFAITSGRPPRGMVMLLEPLSLRTPISGFNGGMMVSQDMTSIEMKAVSP